jgi:hypothetical protein
MKYGIRHDSCQERISRSKRSAKDRARAPWIGVWERIIIGVYMLWIVVLAILLFT